MLESNSTKRRRNRTYERTYDNGGQGAPRLSVRLEPDILSWVRERPEGARAWIEGLAREAMASDR